MAKKSNERPKDINQLAHLIVGIATGEVEDTKKVVDSEVSAAAKALGRKGGLKGGKARAAILTAEVRKAIAQKAAAARWHKSTNQE